MTPVDRGINVLYSHSTLAFVEAVEAYRNHHMSSLVCGGHGLGSNAGRPRAFLADPRCRTVRELA
jgi:hypothetical protein